MYEIVVNPYGRRDDGGRKGLMLQGPWDPSYAAVVKREGIKALYLNSSKGWVDHDCSFLDQVPEIEELSIIAAKVVGLESLHSLKQLRELEVTCSSTSVVDFTQTPMLERVYVYWWAGAASLFNCESLRRVHLDKIARLPEGWHRNWLKLQEFTLANSSQPRLDDLEQRSSLSKLELLNLSRLEDFSVIGRVPSLRWLAICGCKSLKRIDFLRALVALEVLRLEDDGELESLEVLSSLRNLQAVSLVGTTTVNDGDLSPLEALPRLSMLAFAPRRHYTHKLLKRWSWADFGKPDTLLERK